MVKSIVGKVVLGLMFLMSSTILFSQDSKVKYPDISGIWKIDGTSILVTVKQFEQYVTSTCTYGNCNIVWFANGEFANSKVINAKATHYSNGKTTRSNHVFKITGPGKISNSDGSVGNTWTQLHKE
jgi:hypothetical protein